MTTASQPRRYVWPTTSDCKRGTSLTLSAAGRQDAMTNTNCTGVSKIPARLSASGLCRVLQCRQEHHSRDRKEAIRQTTDRPLLGTHSTINSSTRLFMQHPATIRPAPHRNTRACSRACRACGSAPISGLAIRCASDGRAPPAQHLAVATQRQGWLHGTDSKAQLAIVCHSQ